MVGLAMVIDPKIEKNKIFASLLSILIIMSLLPNIVNAIIPQAYIVLLRTHPPSYINIVILLPAILIIFLILYSKRANINIVMMTSLLLFLIYTFLTLIINLSYNSMDYLLPSYINFYYYYGLLVIGLMVSGKIDDRFIERSALTTLVLCSALGIFQYIYNDPIVSVGMPGEDFSIPSWLFSGVNPPHVRGFSLFANALDFGIFLAFCLGIVLYQLRSRNLVSAILLLLTLFAGFATLTRNVYLGMALAAFASALYSYGVSSRALYATAILPFLVVLGIVNQPSDVSSGISDRSSFVTRNYYWDRELSRQNSSRVELILFGSGIYQDGDERSSSKLFVDNTYLQMAAHIGVLGLLFFSLVYCSILRSVIRSPRTPVGSGLYGLLIAWPCMAFFNILIGQLALFALLFILSSKKVPELGKR